MEAMIDREKLSELLSEAVGVAAEKSRYSLNDAIVDYLIANGVVVREKGEWVYDHWCEFKCSRCGALSKTEPRGGENFCSNCGADMRRRENG